MMVAFSLSFSFVSKISPFCPGDPSYAAAPLVLVAPKKELYLAAEDNH